MAKNKMNWWSKVDTLLLVATINSIVCAVECDLPFESLKLCYDSEILKELKKMYIKIQNLKGGKV